jgi:hypothetical protein
MTRMPAALFVISAIWLGAPAIAAPVTPLSGAARPVVHENDLAQARFGWWHRGFGHWHPGHWQSVRYRCRPYCGWGG